jgi:TRAP-type C4-dicarboxylate transport system substrate-binding protein
MKKFFIPAVIICSMILLVLLSVAPSMAAKDPYKLKFATSMSPGSWQWPLMYEPFKKEVEEKSGGRLKIEYYPAESLVKFRDTIVALRNRLCDAGYMVRVYTPDIFPLTEIGALPPLWNTGEKRAMVLRDLETEFFKAECDRAGVHLIGGDFFPAPGWVFSKTKLINKLEDFKGITIRSSNRIDTQLWKSLGALPISMTIYEAYEALQKGILEVSCHTPDSMVDKKWYETGKPGYVIDIGGLGTTSGGFYINKKLYDSMPKDLQKILNDAGWKHCGVAYSRQSDSNSVTGLEFLKKRGLQIIVWSKAEKERLKKQYFDPLAAWWAKPLDAKGIQATKLIERLETIAAKERK